MYSSPEVRNGATLSALDEAVGVARARLLAAPRERPHWVSRVRVATARCAIKFY